MPNLFLLHSRVAPSLFLVPPESRFNWSSSSVRPQGGTRLGMCVGRHRAPPAGSAASPPCSCTALPCATFFWKYVRATGAPEAAAAPGTPTVLACAAQRLQGLPRGVAGLPTRARARAARRWHCQRATRIKAAVASTGRPAARVESQTPAPHEGYAWHTRRSKLSEKTMKTWESA